MTGRAISAVLAAAVFLAPAASGTAQQRYAPYDTIVLAPDEAVDPDLAAFMEAASQALWRFASSSVKYRPPSPAGEVFAETVTVFVGGKDLTPDDRFNKLGRFHRNEFLAFFGQFLDDELIWRRGAEANGARFFSRMSADDMIAPNDMLEGMTCSGSFERLSFERMAALLEETDTTIADWVVAANPDEAGFVRGQPLRAWTIGQLLHIDPEAPPIRSCCWGFVVLPDGTGFHVQVGFGRGPFFTYLTNHVCFSETKKGWRISAVAIRMPTDR